MRDLRLVASEREEYNIDINIVDGYGEFLKQEDQTQDQRAAVSAYMIKGTIPGFPDDGISWSSLYENSNEAETLVNIDNEIRQAIQKNAHAPGTLDGAYVPLYNARGGGITLQLFRG